MPGATKARTAELHAAALDLVTPQVQGDLDDLNDGAHDLERAHRLRALAEAHRAATGCARSTARQHVARALRIRRGERIAADGRGGSRVGAGAPPGNDNRWRAKREAEAD